MADETNFGWQLEVHLQVIADADNAVAVGEGLEAEGVLAFSRTPIGTRAIRQWTRLIGRLLTHDFECACFSEPASNVLTNNISENVPVSGTWTSDRARQSTIE